MICPRCEQGTVLHVRLKKTGQMARICDECDAFWLDPNAVAKESWVDFGTFMQQRGQVGVWDELEMVEGEH